MNHLHFKVGNPINAQQEKKKHLDVTFAQLTGDDGVVRDRGDGCCLFVFLSLLQR